MNKVQVCVGMKVFFELIQSEVGIVICQEVIIFLQVVVQDVEDDFKQLFNLLVEMFWDCLFVFVIEVEIDCLVIDFDGVIGMGFNQWFEIVVQCSMFKNFEFDLKFFVQQKKFSFNLQVCYGYLGIGGDMLVFVFGLLFFDLNFVGVMIFGGYLDVFEQIIDFEFDVWLIGFNFLFLLQNCVVKVVSIIVDLVLGQGEMELVNLIFQVCIEICCMVCLVQMSVEQIDFVKKLCEFVEKNFEVEQKCYENGLLMSFQVFEI